MRRRYCDYMKNIQPSEAYVARLEKEMLRELRRRRKNPAPKILAAAAACAAVLAVTLIGVRFARPQPDVIALPKVLTSATASYAPTAEPVETAEPTAAPTAQPSAAYPPDDVRLELQMTDEKAFPSQNIPDMQYTLFFDHLAGSSTHGSRLVEICQSAEPNSVVIAPLRPGTAYWPTAGDGNVAMLTDANGKEFGYAERVMYLDENTNTLKEGWKHTVHSDEPLPEVSDNPVEEIQLPGKVISEHARLLYGRSADAPEVAVLEKDQLIAIGHRVGNWLYVSTEPFCLAGETPCVGWLHISEAAGMGWRTPIDQVDLTADGVNLRQTPDGEKITTLSRDTPVTYADATVPGKNGDWHFVHASTFSKEGDRTGYISADYAKLNTVRLGDELDLTGVASAALTCTENSVRGPASQTVEGEKLNLLLKRLNIACSESVYTEVCGEGSAFITLTYSDGHAIDLPISGDSCTQVRHGPVTYDLKTDAERAERFLNDGGVSIEDILGPVFDEIFTGKSAEALRMSSDSAWNNAIPLGVGKQMLGLTGGKYPLEVRAEPYADAPVTAVLLPGTAHWPTHADQVSLSDEFYCEEIKWWDSEVKQMRTGWMLEQYGKGEAKEAVSTMEVIDLPGRFIADDTPLRYGPSEEAPVITTMSANQLLFLCARDGDWIFTAYGDWPAPDFCGWVHVNDVEALQVRESLTRIDLLADKVEIFGDPDGSKIAVMTPDKAQDGFIAYMGTTLTTEGGQWHYVGYRERYEDDTSYGFVRADQTQLYTFTLADELSLEGAASATLVRTLLDPYGKTEQLVEGDRLSALLDVLSGAYSKEVYRPFSNESVLTLRLAFEDGREENLYLHSEGEPFLRFGDVTYDLRSDAQRAGDFVNGERVSLSDILSPIFDLIGLP